jgi:redox-sensitive bicupin YhaK (pirin superfamily)
MAPYPAREPSDLDQMLKPFVFLDHFVLPAAAAGIGLHPHSGIATLTYLFEGTMSYENSNGVRGVVPAGGVEWFKAARGAWHAGGPGDSGVARGLWLALGSDELAQRRCTGELSRGAPPKRRIMAVSTRRRSSSGTRGGRAVTDGG